MSARQYITVFLFLATALHASAEIKNQGWWKNSVFYQIYPRSFMDGDKDDGIGDLKGITSKLDHFVDAGVKGIWLSPIYKSPMKDFGYDISDFRNIHEDFGTLKDLEALVKRAKELGLKVILDLVPNHTSDQHEWFQKSVKGEEKYKDYYIWVDPVTAGDTTTPPNNWLSVFGGPAWTYNSMRKQWYFHQFLKEQPDLNYRNSEVEREMKEIIEYWLQKGIDGFRIDAVPHLFEISNITLNEPLSNAIGVEKTDYAYLNHIYTKDQNETYDLVNKWRTIVDNYANNTNEDEKVIMTEAYTTLENTLKFYQSGAHVPFNFKFITDVNSESSAADFKKTMDAWINGIDSNSSVPNWVMGNHDRKRIATRYPNRADQMTMLAMILPGVAVTYYGEEIGMEDNNKITWEETVDQQACNAGRDKFQLVSRDPCRTPFQWKNTRSAGFSSNESTWLPVNANYNTLNLEQQKKDLASHYSVYTNLTRLKNSTRALKTGSYQSILKNNDKLLVIARESDEELVTLVINFSDKEEKIDVSKVTTKTLAKTETRVASVGSKVVVGQQQNNHAMNVPAGASVVLYSTFKEENNSATTEQSNSLLTILLLLLIATALQEQR
ncbi:hypothetical protein KPH14_010985 [Odynerus spinipes]|uniref:alpha-glucosidase n=1 Tax=Odynerus spinipes TaxID=1348599 RepID=A0AAD9RWE2_9HYME|nr:hypothetical protein KPH14_010985 [Odynerus spinipes]